MKQLLLLLSLMLISFNSFGFFFWENVCVETDAQDKDGIIYLTNKTKPFSGKSLCKYENGQNKNKGKYKDGNRSKVWKGWYENCQIKFEKTYNFGQLVKEINYQKGEANNYFQSLYFDSGQIKSEGNFKKNNKKDGKFNYWHENGDMRMETSFTDGKEEGRSISWNPDETIF